MTKLATEMHRKKKTPSRRMCDKTGKRLARLLTTRMLYTVNATIAVSKQSGAAQLFDLSHSSERARSELSRPSLRERGGSNKRKR